MNVRVTVCGVRLAYDFRMGTCGGGIPSRSNRYIRTVLCSLCEAILPSSLNIETGVWDSNTSVSISVLLVWLGIKYQEEGGVKDV